MGITKIFSVIFLLLLVAVAISGCERCTQESYPPTAIDTSDNPYHFAWLTTNLNLSQVTWLNRTTGEFGSATITGPEEHCIWPLGCFDALSVEMDVNLVPGENSIQIAEYQSGSSCAFYDEYLITYIP